MFLFDLLNQVFCKKKDMRFIVSSPILRQYAVVIAVNLIVVSVGLGLAWPSPVLVKLRNEAETVLPRPITTDEGSWIVSVLFLCGTFASFLPGVLVDKIGRKHCIILGCIPKIIVGLLYTFATRLWMVILGRVLNGIADAFIMGVVPIYASEIGSKEVRGSLGTFTHIFLSFGILVMLSMGPVVSYLTVNIVVTSAALLATVPVIFLPESPYFLYSKGETADAIKILTVLRGSETIVNEEIKEYAISNTDSSVNKLKLFRDRIFVKSFIMVIVIGGGTQLLGHNVVTFYLQTILESTQASLEPETGSAIIGGIQLVAGTCATFITDRFGRKPILTVTILGTAIGMLGLGVFFKVTETQQTVTGALNYMPLVSLILVVYCFSAGPSSLYLMLVTELFDGPARGVGVSSSLVTAMLCTFLSSNYFPDLINVLGPAVTYWIFSGNCVLMALFILLCVPETRGKTFAEIQERLGLKRVVYEDDGEKGSD